MESKKACEMEKEKSTELYHSVTEYSLDSIIGNGEAIKELKNEILKIAPTSQTVMIRGESGTGKELIAHSIHSCSRRKERPFVRVNCAAIPENLFESEFFGYIGGSFSGALKNGKKGKFEMADQGTLFLDEIGELPLFMQSKLLRVLQEKEIVRVGGTMAVPIDVRIIVATNKDLCAMVHEGTFREDLYYRLNVLYVKAPPLREHLEDIPALSEGILEELNKENGIQKHLSAETLKALQKYYWRGNVRELNNILVKMYFHTESEQITLENVPRYIRNSANYETVMKYRKEGMGYMIDVLEQKVVMQTLKETDNNVSKAAELLKISRPKIYQIIQRYESQTDKKC